MFGWMKGGKNGASSAADARIKMTVFNTIVDIPSRQFMGQFAKSPNGKYLLAWGQGKCLLLQDRRIIVDYPAVTPNDGKVADNGTFIVNDWEEAPELRGTFLAVDVTGRLIFKRRFKASLYNNGLARDASLAVCQTCNSPGSADSSVLAVFDLVNGVELSAASPESGWAQSYGFETRSRKIGLEYATGRRYDYAAAGGLVDRARWIRDELERGNWVVADRIMQESDGKLAPEIKAILRSGLENQAAKRDVEPSTRARCLRVIGECLERDNDVAGALERFEAALKLDAKVGLKRRVEQLKKQLSD